VTTCLSPSTSTSHSREVITSPTVSDLVQHDSWLNSFQIPWPSLLHAVDNKPIPSAVDVRELVNHTVSDMFVHTRRASRAVLRSVAQKIVQRRPLSFADYINGKMVGNGVESIMLMLESKKENLNRRVKPALSDCEPASKRQNTSNGERSKVIRRTSALPDAETVDRQEATRAQLHSWYHAGSSVSSQVESGMLGTYTYQRYHANTETTVSNILDKWPFLRLTKFVLMDRECYTGVDVEPRLRSGVLEQCELIHDFMESTRSPVTAAVLRAMNAGNEVHWRSYFLPITMAYFREDVNSVLQFFPVCAKNVGLVVS